MTNKKPTTASPWRADADQPGPDLSVRWTDREENGGDKTPAEPGRSTLEFGAAIARVFILSLVCVLVGCRGSVLPPERVLLTLEDAQLRDLVLAHIPLGTSRQAAEQTFKQSFRKNYVVIDYESAALISQRGFSMPVRVGDYYLRSDLASKIRISDFGTCDVVTVYLLFDSTGRLKDVAVRQWIDSM